MKNLNQLQSPAFTWNRGRELSFCKDLKGSWIFSDEFIIKLIHFLTQKSRNTQKKHQEISRNHNPRSNSTKIFVGFRGGWYRCDWNLKKKNAEPAMRDAKMQSALLPLQLPCRSSHWDCLMFGHHTVDGWNPAPPRMIIIPLFIGVS